MSRIPRIGVFILYLAINTAVHIPFLNLPPCGAHVWRQCNTLAMSRNFQEESLNLFYPRIDRRNETNGITGSHFPLYEWSLAVLSGNQNHFEFKARVFSAVLFTGAMFALFLILLFFGVEKRIAMMGGVLLLSIPQLYYDSINAMPDILALSASLFSLLFTLKFSKSNTIAHALPAVLFAMVGGLVKFQFLIVPFSAIAFLPLNRKSLVFFTGSALVIGLTVFLWYRYALELTQLNNLKEYGLWITQISVSRQWETIVSNLVSDLPEMLIGWPLFLFLLYLSIKWIRKTKRGPALGMGILWISGFLVFYFLAIERMKHHSYYFIAILPFLVIVVVYLSRYLKKPLPVLFAVCILNISWAMVRIIPSRWTNANMQIPYVFRDDSLRNRLSSVIPENAITICGADASGCIFFYFTHTKGFSFKYPNELSTYENTIPKIEEYRKKGARYLLIQDSPSIQRELEKIERKKRINKTGDFEIWLLE